MATYLLSLCFSTQAQNAQYGQFVPYFGANPGFATTSRAWYSYGGSGAIWTNGLSQVTSLNSSDWTFLGASDTYSPSFVQGDYIVIRIFRLAGDNTDSLGILASFIWGAATQLSSSGPANIAQSPLRLGGNPVAALSYPMPAVASWPVAFTIENGGTVVPTWSYCLGQINALTNASFYGFSVGAAVVDFTNSSNFYFGLDPTVKVGGKGAIDEDGDDDGGEEEANEPPDA